MQKKDIRQEYDNKMIFSLYELGRSKQTQSLTTQVRKEARQAADGR